MINATSVLCFSSVNQLKDCKVIAGNGTSPERDIKLEYMENLGSCFIIVNLSSHTPKTAHVRCYFNQLKMKAYEADRECRKRGKHPVGFGPRPGGNEGLHTMSCSVYTE